MEAFSHGSYDMSGWLCSNGRVHKWKEGSSFCVRASCPFNNPYGCLQDKRHTEEWLREGVCAKQDCPEPERACVGVPPFKFDRVPPKCKTSHKPAPLKVPPNGTSLQSDNVGSDSEFSVDPFFPHKITRSPPKTSTSGPKKSLARRQSPGVTLDPGKSPAKQPVSSPLPLPCNQPDLKVYITSTNQKPTSGQSNATEAELDRRKGRGRSYSVEEPTTPLRLFDTPKRVFYAKPDSTVRPAMRPLVWPLLDRGTTYYLPVDQFLAYTLNTWLSTFNQFQSFFQNAWSYMSHFTTQPAVPSW